MEPREPAGRCIKGGLKSFPIRCIQNKAPLICQGVVGTAGQGALHERRHSVSWALPRRCGSVVVVGSRTDQVGLIGGGWGLGTAQAVGRRRGPLLWSRRRGGGDGAEQEASSRARMARDLSKGLCFGVVWEGQPNRSGWN
jgi:hypothetical protein